ncbi:MAG TPA: hypothetical protein VGO80_11615 [Solirubrobacteraceae bacterium]|jgi:hypothetical protein|nr:hypothetical protein [Solirubrobacteraceae bacterium]
MPDSYATQPYGHRSAPSASAGGGLDVKTLFLTAIASAAAAYTCSKLWAPGTLASAAFTPVLVALIREVLAKPTEVVARAVPVRGVVRSAEVQGPQPPDPGWSAMTDGQQLGGDHAAPAPSFAGDPASRVAQPGEIQYHSTRRGLRGWRLAVMTGLLGFLICAVVFTVPELMAGGSIAGGGRDTTLFSGGSRHKSPAPVVTETTAPTQTVTAPPSQTVTVPPTKTVTVPPPTTTTPAAPVDPATTVPTTTNPDEPGVDQPPAAPPPG